MLGQDEARRALAVLLTRQVSVREGIYKDAIGVLAYGRTGVGKTYLISEMCARAGLPFAVADATQFSDKGYAGADLSQMFLKLIRVCIGRTGLEYRDEEADTSLFGRSQDVISSAVQRAQTGVILLDEFDKWMVDGKTQATPENRSIGRKLQAELLNMVQGTVLWVSDRDDELGVDFDTSRVMIICAGAFVGLQDRVLDRLHHDQEYEDETLWTMVEPQDFLSMGMIPELAGRLATHLPFKPLRAEHVVRMLEQEHGFVDEYRTRFHELGCELAIDEAGLRTLGAQAIRRGLGARGLRHVLERAMGPALFAAAEHQARGVLTSCRLDVRAAEGQLVVRPR